jgi:DNA primase
MILLDVSSEIQSLANQYLDKVKRSGPDNIMAVCPFHRKMDGSPEHTPSFAMNLANGLYLCHSCGSKGNLYTFLRDIGVTRNDISLKFSDLIEAASTNTPPKLNFLDPKVSEENPLPESLLGVFDRCPTSLLAAGFNEQTLRHFDVGFDVNHSRITFPLRDFQGRLAGISGRDVTGESIRYKVYDKEYPTWGLPERIQPEKRRLLWNIHDVYPDLYFSSGPSDILVVEGFKACMWCWQAGIKNVVALLGTYVSEEQRWILERLGATVHLFLDYNYPGLAGTYKAIDKLSRSCKVKVVPYPDRIVQDPDRSAQPDDLSTDEVLAAQAQSVDYVCWLHSLN